MYIEIEELENKFRQYDIPYTNIFDELQKVSAKDIANNLSVLDLSIILGKKDQVIATQIWTKDDILAILESENMDMNISEDSMARIIAEAKPRLEDCSDNEERLRRAVFRNI